MYGGKRTLLWRLALARIKAGRKQALLRSAAVLFSMFTVSFFVLLLAELLSLRPAGNFPFGRFLANLTGGLQAVAIILTALAVLSLYLYSGLQKEDDQHFLATLTSIGATRAQRRGILQRTQLLLYSLPVVLGVLLALLPATLFMQALTAGMGLEAAASPVEQGALLLGLIAAGELLVLLFFHVRQPRERAGVIAEMRRHNREEAEAMHSYRQSYTFRRMPLEQRIAQKSVAYYKRPYRRISLMFASVGLYPILAVVFFMLLASERITADTNPYDGIDTSAATVAVVSSLAIFAAIAFLLLCLFGIAQAAYMVAMQNRLRRKTLAVYRSVGMTERGVRRVLTYEYRTVAFHALLYILFVAVVLVGLLL